jgi:hypothetical protein
MRLPDAGPFLKIKNWETYQHYKNRKPPWIKLHVELLDNYEFGRLQDASKAHAICIMLLAARTDNHIPNDPAWVSMKIGARSEVDLSSMVSLGFLITCDCKRCASDMLASDKQSAIAETEAYKEETENRGARKRGRKGPPDKSTYGPEFEEFYRAFPKHEAKADGYKAFLELRAKGELPEISLLVKAAEEYGVRKAPEYQKLPGGWLRDRRWEDEPASVQSPVQEKSYDEVAWEKRGGPGTRCSDGRYMLHAVGSYGTMEQYEAELAAHGASPRQQRPLDAPSLALASAHALLSQVPH